MLRSFVLNKKVNMVYPFISIGLATVFVVYVLYLLFIKKDMKKLKSIVPIGLFFIVIWILIYYFLFR